MSDSAIKPAPTAERSFVAPREFVGQARLLRQRIEAASKPIDAVTLSLTKRLVGRLATSTTIRRGKLVDAERLWNTSVPAFGRIAIEHDIADLRSPVFQELRVIAGQLHFPEWAEGARELCLNLVRIGISVRDRKPVYRHATLALIGLHSLARRYQRGRDASDDAILADISALASVERDASMPQFIQTTAGGRWCGELVRLVPGGPPVAAVRTFYDDDHQAGDQTAKGWQKRVAARDAAARSG